MGYERFQSEQLILRDELALDRTRLANERTVLAYLRTAIMLVGTGVTLLKLFGESTLNEVTAGVVIALGLLAAVIGIARFFVMRRSLNRLDRATPSASSSQRTGP